jgi:hypothetical protein
MIERNPVVTPDRRIEPPQMSGGKPSEVLSRPRIAA